jgi:hypothetical protein
MEEAASLQRERGPWSGKVFGRSETRAVIIQVASNFTFEFERVVGNFNNFPNNRSAVSVDLR